MNKPLLTLACAACLTLGALTADAQIFVRIGPPSTSSR
jgi:hypothetical protein